MINTRLVILDRDGVINRDSDHYIKSPAEWEPIPGSVAAITRLNQSGFYVVVATNQSGVARGLFDFDTLNAIHEKMGKTLAVSGGHVDAVFFCPHTNDMGCKCRKPSPGMFLNISERFNCILDHKVWAIGDSLRDLQAAHNANCLPVLVHTGKGAKTASDGGLPPDTLQFPDLSAAADALLQSISK